MNQCYGCTTCESADKPLEGFIKNLPLETSHHRVEGQSTKCAFGLQGVCCRLCSNGPCRITPDAPRGICGANADTIVARNFLRAVASGSGCYIHVVENTARNVKNAAQKKSGIKGDIEAGVRIYLYTPGFIHSKCIVADDDTAIVGTCNLDFRSMYWNFEDFVYMYRTQCIGKIKEDAIETFAVSEEVYEESTNDISFAGRLLQSILQLFAPLL